MTAPSLVQPAGRSLLCTFNPDSSRRDYLIAFLIRRNLFAGADQYITKARSRCEVVKNLKNIMAVSCIGIVSATVFVASLFFTPWVTAGIGCLSVVGWTFLYGVTKPVIEGYPYELRSFYKVKESALEGFEQTFQIDVTPSRSGGTANEQLYQLERVIEIAEQVGIQDRIQTLTLKGLSIKELTPTLFQNFPKLSKIEIDDCKHLRSLPRDFERLEELSSFILRGDTAIALTNEQRQKIESLSSLRRRAAIQEFLSDL